MPKRKSVLAREENGRMVVTLDDGKGRVETVSVAEVVLETFVGPRPSPDHIPRHKDGNVFGIYPPHNSLLCDGKNYKALWHY